eukprot:g4108.t1
MLSIGRLIQYSIIYGMYYLFRVALVKQWKTGASPKVALDFNGYYSILKQLFDLKASIQLTLPNLFSTHINIEISNHMAEVENRPARRESIAPADVCRMSKQNKIKESAPAKGNVGDSQKELAKVKNVEANEIEPKENNNFEPRAAGQSLKSRPLNPLLSQIRTFNTQSLTPPRKQSKVKDPASGSRKDDELGLPFGSKHSMFDDLAAGLKKRRARLSTAVFKKNVALLNRGVYDDDDSENDGDGGRWSTGTDESDSIIDNTRNVTSDKTISENLKTDGQRPQEVSRVTTPDLLNTLSSPVHVISGRHIRSNSVIHEPSKLRHVNSEPIADSTNQIIQKKTKCIEDHIRGMSSEKHHGNKENEGDENIFSRTIMQKEDDVRVDERLSVHSEKLDMLSPRHSRRRSRSRRHIIYVPSTPEGVNGIEECDE